MTISIVYCSECNYLPQALEVARGLLERMADEIDELVLVPAAGGAFEVRKDGELIFDMMTSGGFPDVSELIQKLSGKIRR
ncbi:MAG: Rdx family protein [Armatimonadota bacterium]|nr:Rdx family protein [Armatimonadota bacterium]MDR7438574.1 Rdx family protein [Armatimonadota bacterium]MDR7563752.1 Rdx family protein [Armatimonadota bacterium]MDR7567359.1 Rdx family protein [Armatimonadota bacterium]MDR7602626.1 Rdx family protein [Armatimonadota bacterium]